MVTKKDGEYLIQYPPAPLVSALSGLVDEHHAIIAGGAFKDIGIGNNSSGQVRLGNAKDIDLYFRSTEDYERAVEKCQSTLGRIIYSTSNSTGFYHPRGFYLDLVKTPYPDAKSILDTFDFTVTKAAFYKNDAGEYQLLKHHRFDEHLAKRVLDYAESYDPDHHQYVLERLWRYTHGYSFRLTEDTLRAALGHKVRTAQTLSGLSVDEILDVGKSAATVQGKRRSQLMPFNTKTKEPVITPNLVLKALLDHAHLSPDNADVTGSRAGSNKYFERDFERSIVHAVKYGHDTDAAQTDVRYAEQVMDVQIMDNPLLGIHLSATQVGFVDHLSTLNLSTSEYDVLVTAVLGNNGFIAKNQDHGIYCNYEGVPVALTHRCDHDLRYGRNRKSKVHPDARRDEDAEIMVRLLSMSADQQWHQDVAAYFAVMLEDEYRTKFLTFFEWEDAINDEVFSPELPFGLLYEMVRYPEEDEKTGRS